MTSRLLTACFLCLLLCAGSGRAQDGKGKSDKRRPDLTGTWVLDETLTARDKSKRGGAGGSQVTLLISHREPEIKITRKVVSAEGERTRESIYYADGRGETNLGSVISIRPAGEEVAEIKSETSWKKDKLVTTSGPLPVRGAFITVRIIEEWSLSPDGQVLTQTSVVKTARGYDYTQPAPRGMKQPTVGEPVIISMDPVKFKKMYRRVAGQ